MFSAELYARLWERGVDIDVALSSSIGQYWVALMGEKQAVAASLRYLESIGGEDVLEFFPKYMKEKKR